MFNTDNGLCPTCDTLLRYLFGAQYYCPNECDKKKTPVDDDRANSPVPGFLVGDKILNNDSSVGLGEVIGFGTGPTSGGKIRLYITYVSPYYPGYKRDTNYYIESLDSVTRLSNV